METDEVLLEKQKAAAFLRERFLFLIASLPAKTACTINMHNNTEVEANIRGFDQSFENILVEKLKPSTQLGVTIPNAILRTSDILTITYKND